MPVGIARKAEAVGVRKTRLDTMRLLALAVLCGGRCLGGIRLCLGRISV